jgi:hypothetical protein
MVGQVLFWHPVKAAAGQWVDTAEEYDFLDAVAADRAEASA